MNSPGQVTPVKAAHTMPTLAQIEGVKHAAKQEDKTMELRKRTEAELKRQRELSAKNYVPLTKPRSPRAGLATRIITRAAPRSSSRLSLSVLMSPTRVHRQLDLLESQSTSASPAPSSPTLTVPVNNTLSPSPSSSSRRSASAPRASTRSIPLRTQRTGFSTKRSVRTNQYVDFSDEHNEESVKDDVDGNAATTLSAFSEDISPTEAAFEKLRLAARRLLVDRDHVKGKALWDTDRSLVPEAFTVRKQLRTLGHIKTAPEPPLLWRSNSPFKKT